jgi:hypothetical protein
VTKNDVQLGFHYIVKVSGKLTRVRLDSESPYGGWNGTNLVTGRPVRIRTAAKLRRPIANHTCTGSETCVTCGQDMGVLRQ